MQILGDMGTRPTEALTAIVSQPRAGEAMSLGSSRIECLLTQTLEHLKSRAVPSRTCSIWSSSEVETRRIGGWGETGRKGGSRCIGNTGPLCIGNMVGFSCGQAPVLHMNAGRTVSTAACRGAGLAEHRSTPHTVFVHDTQRFTQYACSQRPMPLLHLLGHPPYVVRQPPH
jgi:hypothetical protein